MPSSFLTAHLDDIHTFIDTAAEATLEAATSLDELHVGTHVGLASVAADRARLAVVHNIQRSLHRQTHPKRHYGHIFNSC